MNCGGAVCAPRLKRVSKFHCILARAHRSFTPMIRFSISSRYFELIAVWLTLGAGVAAGQSTFGSLLGTVRDSSGGVVSGCSISMENTGTSARRAALTDQNGSYSVPNLEPGVYEIKMSAPGFQLVTYTNVQLLARQSVRIDGAMK